MLDRIVVDVIDMLLQVRFITNLVFPEPALPDSTLPFSVAGKALGGLGLAGGEISASETSLDSRPAQGKITIIRRQFPDAMQMLGQQAYGNHFEMAALFRFPPRSSKAFARQQFCQKRAAVVRHDREEVVSTFETGPPVVSHGCIPLITRIHPHGLKPILHKAFARGQGNPQSQAYRFPLGLTMFSSGQPEENRRNFAKKGVAGEREGGYTLGVGFAGVAQG